MNMLANYLTLDILILLFPFLFSFKWVFPYYKNYKPLAASILIVGGAYIFWDILVTFRGDWWFNHEYLVDLGFTIGGIPLEEALFFVVVPYSCIFIYENLQYFFPDAKLGFNKWVYYSIAILLAIVAIIFYHQEYTILALLSVTTFLLIAATWFPDLLQSRNYWAYIGLSFVAFIIFNYLLTSIPIVLYNPNAIWGGTVDQIWYGRFITIPFEDFFYNFSMLSFYLLVYRYFKKRWITPHKKTEQHTRPDSVIQKNTQPHFSQNNQWMEVKNERADFQERIDSLYQKNQSLNLSEVISLKDHPDSSQLKKAEELLETIENQYAEYERLQKELKDNKIKTNRLTDRLANGELDSESYKRALDDLDSSRKEKEERLWTLRNKLFKEDYEKPF
jgi:lycopene cyclase domain-containing protein